MPTNLDKLRTLLQELFQLDQADLDFGIYRIMNTKRDEVVRFLDKDLLPQVQEAFKQYKSADKSVLQAERDKLVASIQSAGMNPDESPKVQELDKRIADCAVDVTALENEVFSHLFNFFRRYYSEGDFISLRRYKEGVYAIPYEGEEVKLHWANHDQYYIKSSETFKDYTFKIPSGKRVRVHLVAASTEQDNNKAAPGKERRFVLCADQPLLEENGELFIRFEYRPSEGKEKQADLNQQAVEAVLKTPGFEQWAMELGKPAPTDKNKNRTVLEKHLTQYTARNTFDYFIHKDLGGFLRRELDFYIKNEVMHLDDIEHESAPKVEQYLSQIKVIRAIAHKIILFLEQLENFQKKLWLKKKFVIETNYCITLDRVPEELYPEIAANDVQREEWVRLFAIDEIKGDLHSPGYSKPLKVKFLKAYPTLVLNTQHFSDGFTNRLLQTIDNIDEQTDGVLIHGENFQALCLLHQRYREQVKCIYIDPPYNGKSSEFLYKNTFKHSSWLALMENRLSVSRLLLAKDGCTIVAIDESEQERLGLLVAEIYPTYESTCVSVVHNPAGVQGANFSYTHESAIFIFPSEGKYIGYTSRDDDLVSPLRDWGGTSARTLAKNCFYPIIIHGDSIVDIGEVCSADFHPEKSNIKHDDLIYVYPIDTNGTERKWVFSKNSVENNIDQLFIKKQDGLVVVMRRKTDRKYRTVWDDKRYYANIYGSKLLSNLFGHLPFSFPKSLYLVQDSIKAITSVQKTGSVILDFFAGSGTTGHAVINLNREDGGRRKFILIETGNYFDTVLFPRINKVTFTPTWKDGKPNRMATKEETERSPHVVKFLRLESYEDALNNLELKRTDKQSMLLGADAEMREEYMLSYMLDVESRGSQSLLNIESFRNPDQYKLKVERNGESQLVNVDLVETFNWLLGLTVKHIDVIRGVRVVEGTNPQGDRVLVLWRDIDETDNDKLDQWFQKQGYSTRDLEYDLVYVNGDNNLENLRRVDQTWKVRLIEEEFHRLMFDVQDV